MAGTLASRLLLPAPLTDTGRPVLRKDEVEVYFSDDVSIEFEGPNEHVQEAETLRHGLSHLTTHRLFWLEEFCLNGGNRRSYCLPLQIVGHWTRATSFWKSPRLKMSVFCSEFGDLALEDGRKSKIVSVVFVFRSKIASFDTFCSRFSQQLEKKLWEKQLPENSEANFAAEAPGAGTVSSLGMAGISGIIRREQQQLRQTDQHLTEAFSDLNALMAKAQEMVKLAETIRSKLNPPSTPQPQQSGESDASAQDMQDWLLSVGIVSPVTKDSAGASYHKELAKELADFFGSGPIHKAGGMLSLVDAYCIINKARGTELISPDDMLRACEIWNTMAVPMVVKKFESGVTVIQHKVLSEDKILNTIASLVARKPGGLPGVNAGDLSRKLGIAPSLAKEQLLIAESQGVLCRDDSMDGLVFYHNFFRDLLPQQVS